MTAVFNATATVLAFSIAVLLSPFPAVAGPRIVYPAVFDSAERLKTFGIVLRGYGPDGGKIQFFKNRCYFYGDGGNDISVSDEFLARYVAKGFSLNSLCLALQSPLRFNPETGHPVPSYMVADLEVIRKADAKTRKTNAFDIGVISQVLPLAVPKCFKRGLPYQDCKFLYDIQTGKRLTRQQLADIETGRATLTKQFDAIKKNNAYSKECGCSELKSDLQPDFSTKEQCRVERVLGCEPESNLIKGTLRAEGYSLFPVFGNSGIRLIDISPSLPLGYGYQLWTDGGAAPEGGDATLASNDKARVTDGQFAALVAEIGSY